MSTLTRVVFLTAALGSLAWAIRAIAAAFSRRATGFDDHAEDALAVVAEPAGAPEDEDDEEPDDAFDEIIRFNFITDEHATGETL